MVGVRARGPYTWSARRLSITTTTTFIAPGGAGWRWKLDLPDASSLSQPAAPSRPRPAAPAPPALIRRRRVRSWLNWLEPGPRPGRAHAVLGFRRGQVLDPDRFARQLPRHPGAWLHGDRRQGGPAPDGRADRAGRPDRALCDGRAGLRRDRAR